MAVRYSPLCDSDKELYAKYLAVADNVASTFAVALQGTVVGGVGGGVGYELGNRFMSVLERVSGDGSGHEGVGQVWTECGSFGTRSKLVSSGNVGGTLRGEETVSVGNTGENACSFETVEVAAAVGEGLCADSEPLGDVERSVHGSVVCGGGSVRGLNFKRNKAARDRKKKSKGFHCREKSIADGNVSKVFVPEWRRKNVGKVEEDVASVRCETVYSSGASTLAGAEEEARKTLALRRVAENKLATAKAEAMAASYADKAKTEALQELAALRIAQRANEARAKSQSSWKKCEESLGSLGSTGSAGEYWMKKEVEKGRQWQKKYQQLRKQSEYMYAHVTQQVRDELLAMDGTISVVSDGCEEDLQDLDDYLAQNVEVAGKDLATMEEEFRNFKF